MTTLLAPNTASEPSALGIPLTDDEADEEEELAVVMQQASSMQHIRQGNSSESLSREKPAINNRSQGSTVADERQSQEPPKDDRDMYTPELTPSPRQPLLDDSGASSSSVDLQTTDRILKRRQQSPPPNTFVHANARVSYEELEDRVSDLEAKLSTLTILLQASNRQGSSLVVGHSPTVTRSGSPKSPSSPEHVGTAGASPPLESPVQLSRSRHRTRLSEVLLCDYSAPPTPKNCEEIPVDHHEEFLESTPNLPTLEPPCTEDIAKESMVVETNASQKPSKSQWLDFLNSFQESTADVDMQMEEFVRVPSKVEQLLGFGFWICVDCFLYVITVLPIRFVWSCLLGVLTILGLGAKQGPYRFHRRHMYQMIQVMLKLYLLIAIVEVFDRLMCSLGQDCLDSLYWNTTNRPHSSRMLVSMSVVLVYAMVHTLLLFVHVATLNVAMNSADQALLSLLIGGNFAEIKSTVFKKYNKQHLFKITASDICERFKLALFLMLVLILNLCQGMDRRMVYDFCSMCGIVYLAELLSDWVKHSFITKFNFIKSSVYPEYALLLAGDVTGIGHEGVNLDHSHAVVKRIGLAQIPLVCVMFRYLAEAARYASPHLDDVRKRELLLYVFAVWCVLLAVKFVSGSLLLKVASRRLENAPEVVLSAKKRTPQKQKRKSKLQ